MKRQQVLGDAWKAYKASAPSDDAAFKQGWIKARAEALTKAGMDSRARELVSRPLLKIIRILYLTDPNFSGRF